MFSPNSNSFKFKKYRADTCVNFVLLYSPLSPPDGCFVPKKKPIQLGIGYGIFIAFNGHGCRLLDVIFDVGLTTIGVFFDAQCTGRLKHTGSATLAISPQVSALLKGFGCLFVIRIPEIVRGKSIYQLLRLLRVPNLWCGLCVCVVVVVGGGPVFRAIVAIFQPI